MTTGFDSIGNNKALQDHWFRRAIALVIDGVILVVIAFLISIFFWILAPWGFIGWFFVGLLMFLYFVLFEMIMGGTPGKKMLSLEVVSTQGELDFVASLIRNVSKIFWLFLLLDWLIGMFTDGDPRQKFTDRYANTTVQRTDQQAYMEQQFRQMAYVPPHPTYQPPPAQPQQQSYQPPPQQQVQPQQQAGSWPNQEPQPKSDWPTHDANQTPPQQSSGQQPAPQPDAPRFCQNCGSSLSPGPDGRLTCGNCGKTY